jgi:hypothetical protein
VSRGTNGMLLFWVLCSLCILTGSISSPVWISDHLFLLFLPCPQIAGNWWVTLHSYVKSRAHECQACKDHMHGAQAVKRGHAQSPAIQCAPACRQPGLIKR